VPTFFFRSLVIITMLGIRNLVFAPTFTYEDAVSAPDAPYLSWQAETSRTARTDVTSRTARTDLTVRTARTDFSLEDFAVDDDSDDEGRTACDNLVGLLQYLDELQSRKARIIQVTHVVNRWIIDGVVLPMKHHGLVFKVGPSTYLRTHLVREGLAWKVYDAFPPLPETTCQSETYKVNSSVAPLRKYCAETEEWSWPNNDCDAWARGAMQAVGAEDRAPTLLGSLMSVCQRAPPVKAVVI